MECSAVDVAQATEQDHAGNKVFGMENFGNTCYSNSILQCLYYSKAFRESLLQHNPTRRDLRSETRGIKPHAFTAKYEQIIAKKIKDQRSDGQSAPPPTAASASSALEERPKAQRKGLLFGRKFTPVNHSPPAATVVPDNKAVSTCLVSCAECELLPLETRHKLAQSSLGNLQVMVTHTPPLSVLDSNLPLIDTSAGTHMQNALSLLQDTAEKNQLSVDPGVLRMLSVVVVGMPIPEPRITEQINPFSANPSIDHRKRLALINGPILNVDSILPVTRNYIEISRAEPNEKQDTLLYALRDMYEAMSEHASATGVVLPSHFISTLKEQNYIFRQTNMHQDAHEFFNFLINDIIETLGRELTGPNWCRDTFQGQIANETRCLRCESITLREEPFLDLAVDIPLNGCSYSLSHTLDNYSRLEMLRHQNKFYCNTCVSLQEAQKTSKISKLPQVLVVNFKRFKYDEQLGKMVKLFDPVSYPQLLRLFNTSSDHHRNVPDLYRLYALVVHIGGGPMHGHYVLMCKIDAGVWLLFDDETVEIVDDSYVMRFFGDGPGLASTYILFYERQKQEPDPTDPLADLDLGYNITNIFNGCEVMEDGLQNPSGVSHDDKCHDADVIHTTNRARSIKSEGREDGAAGIDHYDTKPNDHPRPKSMRFGRNNASESASSFVSDATDFLERIRAQPTPQESVIQEAAAANPAKPAKPAKASKSSKRRSIFGFMRKS